MTKIGQKNEFGSQKKCPKYKCFCQKHASERGVKRVYRKKKCVKKQIIIWALVAKKSGKKEGKSEKNQRKNRSKSSDKAMIKHQQKGGFQGQKKLIFRV